MEVHCRSYERQSIGQIIKATKISYKWLLYVGDQRYEIVLRESLLSGKVRVSVNSNEIFHRKMENQQKEIGFCLLADVFGSIEFRKVSPEFELRLNKSQFKEGGNISLAMNDSFAGHSYPLMMNDNRLSPSPSPDLRRQNLGNNPQAKSFYPGSGNNLPTLKSGFENVPAALNHDEYGQHRSQRPSLFGLSDSGSRGSKISAQGQTRSQNDLPNPQNTNLFGDPSQAFQTTPQFSVPINHSKVDKTAITETSKAISETELRPVKSLSPPKQTQQPPDPVPQKPNLTLLKLVHGNSKTPISAPYSPISNPPPQPQFNSADSRVSKISQFSHFSPLTPPTVQYSNSSRPRELMYPNPYSVEVPNIFKLKAI